MLKNILIGIGVTLLIIATGTEISFPPKQKLLYNPSASAPIGWYKLEDKSPLKIGDQVAAYAPDWARKLADERRYLPYEYPMIKTILASSGTQICASNNLVSVPNHPVITSLSQDSLGRNMPKLSGCFTLKTDEYFLISPDVQMGFDSRYFGAVAGKNILGKAKYLGNGKIAHGAKNGK
ncbi:MAG: plasmid transfer protein traf [Alphaproteobacteria bacterium]|nr:MAG: plasmid transfer protein traf [Alphaproteobacteria bacterium]